ncbi:NAD-dependent epimerase/dehydratase family protein [Pontibaca salina]|uniref:NAD-dependent epimerase/dehydratase family protein n=1 Tax=Pontibaca salina TaxID=2795731 RepID=A0A934HU41_9RHOB|nr:NAD-dependent epimerase/dehydratase family protein [Pontibaca salina]MBI6630263.1 NAD-dependent epimerase/dehydratase family protein [Pontibaca salina]
MRVIVTGHLGYIGTVLTPMLLKAGHEVFGMDSDLYERCTFAPGGPIPPVKAVRKDIRHVTVADFLGFDAVVHLAALSNDPLGDFRPDITHSINFQGTMRVAEAAKAAGVSRFVFSSSCSNYGASGSGMIDELGRFNPVTPYGESKVASELALAELSDDRFCPTFLRSATAYGVSPRIRFDLVLNNLVAWAVTTGNIHMKSDGTPWRPITHIEDISRAILATLNAPADAVRNEAFNVGVTEHNYQIRELAEIVADIVPGCEVTFAEDAGPDKRSYRVNCDKIQAVLPDFKPQWDARKGAQSLYDAYRQIDLTLNEFEGPRYQRIGHIKQLISEGIIDETLTHTVHGEAQRPNESFDGMANDFGADAAAATCISCHHAGLQPILDLGQMPRSDGLLDETRLGMREPVLPLRLGYCPDCSLVQLLETHPPEDMFGADYLYFSSFSDDLIKHSKENAADLIRARDLGSNDLVVEIASNDGYMLQNFKAKGIATLGIDPASQPAKAAQEKGIETIIDFFGTRVAQRLKDQGRRANVIIANNVVAHVADQNDLVAGMSLLLADDGVVVVEFPYVRDLIEQVEFDTIYHEHLCYFSLASAKRLFERHGLYLNDVMRLPIHGGSIRLFLEKNPSPTQAVTDLLHEEAQLGLNSFDHYADFGARVRDFRRKAREFIGQLKSEGHRIAAYGAAAKGTIMLNYLGLNARVIEYVVDRNIHKRGKYMPGVRLKIDDPAKLMADRPDYVVILPWNFRDEIIRQQQDFLATGGKFIVPTPELEVVEHRHD